MDYEKKYNEALERAKRLRDSKYQTMNAKRVVEEIFPQLTESEDERIINAIIGIIKTDYIVDINVSQEKMLAWLEKQKEQKPDTPKAYLDLSMDAIEACMLRYMHSAANRKNEIEIFEDTKEYKQKLVELIQKPVGWSEEDEKMLRTIISDGSRGVELDSKQISFLKSLRPKPHWKPSEEQMDALRVTLEYMPDTFKPRCTLMTLQNDLEKLI